MLVDPAGKLVRPLGPTLSLGANVFTTDAASLFVCANLRDTISLDTVSGPGP
jgi:hypothetical protein